MNTVKPETIAAIQRHYEHARTKHPYFCDKLIPDNPRVNAETALRRARLFLQEGIEIHDVDAISICDVEIAEFCAAYEQGDTAAAREEVFDAIAVLLRILDVLDSTQPLGDSAEKVRDIIHIRAVVRYAEDATVNGKTEDPDSPTMPHLSPESEKPWHNWIWEIDIDIDEGRILNWPHGTTARTHYKVCDCCGIRYGDLEYDEYVPDFLCPDDEDYGNSKYDETLPNWLCSDGEYYGKHSGDYLYMTIDDEGLIKNWDKDACRDFIKWMREESKEKKEPANDADSNPLV